MAPRPAEVGAHVPVSAMASPLMPLTWRMLTRQLFETRMNDPSASRSSAPAMVPRTRSRSASGAMAYSR